MNKSFFKAFTIMSIITSISRILGYIRDFIFAFIMGASPLADAFLLAFRIPNFFRRFFAEGAINNAFVPMYLDIKKRNGEKKAELFVGKFMTLLLIFLIFFVLILEFFILQVVSFLAPGFSDELIQKTSFLASIMMPYLILISASSLIGATLNANGRYALWSFSPIILNFMMILGMCYSVYASKITEDLLSWAVLISGLIQFIVLYVWIKLKKIKITFLFPSVNKNIRALLRLLLPNFLAGGIIQINLFVGVFFASGITGAISWLYYSDRIVQLPLGIFAISISTILLTSLSKLKHNQKKYSERINTSFILMLSLTSVCTIGLISVPELIVDILFKRGKFGYGDVRATSDALVMYSLGLPAFGLIKLFSTIFFASKDTKTPFYFSLFSMLLNILLIIYLIENHGHLGIALALSISSWFNVMLLYFGLRIKKIWKIDYRLLTNILKLTLICFCTFVVLNACHFLFLYHDIIIISNLYKKILFLICLMIITGLVFTILCFFFNLLKIKDIKDKLFKKSLYGK